MRRVELEALVVGAIGALRTGNRVEDDRIEFKRDWPLPDKARQLAAAANSAAGEPLIFVIGVDDKDGSIHPLSSTDPAAWWDQMKASFDQQCFPELVHHVVVFDTSPVVVLMFETDRAPYVINARTGGAPEREVPVRDGTGTRSAHRSELLRLLYPPSRLPDVSSLDAILNLTDVVISRGEVVPQFYLELTLFFEAPHDARVFLPWHMTSAELPSSRFVFNARLEGAGPGSEPNSRGANTRLDGLELEGSGVARLSALWKAPGVDLHDLGAVESWRVRLGLGIPATARQAIVSMWFENRTVERLEWGDWVGYRWAMSA